jgi:hypothetical protein
VSTTEYEFWNTKASRKKKWTKLHFKSPTAERWHEQAEYNYAIEQDINNHLTQKIGMRRKSARILESDRFLNGTMIAGEEC